MDIDDIIKDLTDVGNLNSIGLFADSIIRFKQKYKLHAELKKYKGHRMYICGHSLGSAAAALLASDFSDDYDIELVMFGCPKIGGSVFRDSFARKAISVSDYKTKYDVVTKLPWQMLGYVPLTEDVIELHPEYKPHELLNHHDIQTYIDELEKYGS